MRLLIRQLTVAMLLGALALLPGTAQAMDDNLIGSTLCLAPEHIDIDIDDPGGLDLDRLADRVYDELKRQLTNAGVPFEEELEDNNVFCFFSPYAVFVYVGVTGGSTRAWLIKLEVSDFLQLEYNLWIEVWNWFRFGTLTGGGDALGDDLLIRVRNEIRELVDAWQDVN